MVGGPVVADGVGRSPADPVYDPFWSLANESGVTVCYHGGDSAYSQYLADWGETSEMEAFRQNPFRALISANHHQDNFANLLAHGHFARYPNLRVASIETGSAWVFHLFEKLTKSFGQTPAGLPRGSPRDLQARTCGCRRSTRTSSAGLRDLLGADHILMGSDFPHAEGLAEPVVLHQGPRELQLLRRGLPAGHAGQRPRPVAAPARPEVAAPWRFPPASASSTR